MNYIVLENQKALKKYFPGTTFKADENSRTFQGKMEFKDFSRLGEPCGVVGHLTCEAVIKRGRG